MNVTDLPTGTVTFLFTDIEGSTRLLRRLGDGFHGLIEDHNRLLREAFGEGHIVRTEGDAFFAVFRTAGEAVRAAVAGQKALAAHDWGDATVRVRMGLHTGEGTIAGGDYAGLDVHRAARIAGAAHGGQVLLSEATRALAHGSLGNGVSLRDLGEHRLKDLPEPEHLSQLMIEGLESDFPPPRSLDARPHNLTMRLTPFIGRERELRELKELCAAGRLVTLTGPGGTGKTRLSLEVAAEVLQSFADGAFFVSLAPIAEPELVPMAIAKALDLSEEPGRPILDTLKEHLADREMLLVLDNFEQIVEASPTVAEILDAALRLKCLVTSREVLHLSAEQEYPVPPLALPDPARIRDPSRLEEYESVALFLQRARAVRPDFGLTQENAAAVAEICSRLDGLPLAIELAAARVRLLSPQKILERLEPALPTLTGGARDLPARQQTLRNTIGWSYELLQGEERALFRRLAVFVGGCSLEATETICNPEAELGMDTLEALESLRDKSLLRRSERGEEPRLRMLQVIREYALERLEETEEAAEIHRRHASFFLELARAAAPRIMGAEQPQWLDRLEEEHDNFRSALRWSVEAGAIETALELAGTLWRFWQMRGYLREARERLEGLLALRPTHDHPEGRAAALEAAGGVGYWMGDWEAAARWYQECLDLRRELDEPLRTAEAAYNRACIHLFGGEEHRDSDRAEALLAEAREIFQQEHDVAGLAKVVWATGGNRYIAEDAAGAILPFQESIDLYRRVGDRFGEAWALHMLGLAEIVSNQADEAREHVTQALDIFLEADDRSAIPLLLNDFALLATGEGDGERALRLAGASRALEEEAGVGIVDIGERPTRHIIDRMWSLLPKEEAERCWREGQAMSADEAIAYARKENG